MTRTRPRYLTGGGDTLARGGGLRESVTRGGGLRESVTRGGGLREIQLSEVVGLERQASQVWWTWSFNYQRVEGIEIWLPKRRQTYQRGFITRVGER